MSASLEERYAPVLEETCRATLDERVREEVETLKSILMDDVIIKKVADRPEIIETVIRPSTGCDVDQQYVCVTLEVRLPDRYPDLSPIVLLRNPRGLDDGLLEILHKKIKQMLNQYIGSVVIYSIVELLRGYLTNSNLPSGRCTICLFGFISGDAFIKTQCYHYFHKHCLANHLEASQQSYTEELEKLPNWKRVEAAAFLQTCPVCRSTLFYDVDTLKKAPPPIESENAAPFELTPEMRAMQKKMAALLKKQEAKGGVVSPGDNGPPPLTITTAADFPGGAGASGRGRNAAGSSRQPLNGATCAPDCDRPPVNDPSTGGVPGMGRGAVSRRGAISHFGPQNMGSTGNASRAKNANGANGNAHRGGVTNGNPFRVPPPPAANPLYDNRGNVVGNGFNNASRGLIATANAGRGVISTATPTAPAPAPETPGSPSGRPAYRGPYRGFNRRAKPGRRGQNSR